VIRFGIGYDAHQLVENTPLTMGGVSIPFHRGLAGHSDGDVLTHAMIDALLGSVALGDIGVFFKDTDPNVPKGISSIEMLERSNQLTLKKGWKVVNADATIVAQAPRIDEHVMEMRRVLSAALNTDIENVNVKATTEDRMGFTGSGQGIAAYAIIAVTEVAS
jgi:2-C-methyl-D-erythritol 2,4-cyclodiphosphate synthase